jgi:hypothetical protein
MFGLAGRSRRRASSAIVPIDERLNRKSHVIMWNLYARRIKVDQLIISLVLKSILSLNEKHAQGSEEDPRCRSDERSVGHGLD